MKWMPEKVEGKLSILIMVICVGISILCAQLILLSEEERFTSETRARLERMAERQSYEIRRSFEERVSQGLAANKQVTKAITSEGEGDEKVVYRTSGNGFIRGECPECISGFILPTSTALDSDLKTQIRNSENTWRYLGPAMQNDFLNFYMLTTDNLLRTSPPNEDVDPNELMKFAQTLGELADPAHNPSRLPVWSRPRHYDERNVWVSSLIIPMYDEEEYLGVTISDYKLEQIYLRINQMSMLEGFGQAFLINEDHKLIAHPDFMSVIEAQSLIQDAGLPLEQMSDPILRSLSTHLSGNNDFSGPIDLEVNGEPLFAYIEPIHMMGWDLGVYIDNDQIDEYLATLQWKLIMAAMGIGLIMVLVLRLGLRSLFISRILTLARSTREYPSTKIFDRGDQSNDEIGLLAGAFEDMIIVLEKREAEIIIRNQQLKSEVNERRHVMDSLTESEHKFKTLFNKSADPVIVLDQEKCIDCNEAALQLFKCQNKDTLFDSNFAETYMVCETTQLADWNAKMAHALEEGTCHFEWMICRTNENEQWYDIKLTSIPYQGRTVLYAVVRDITDRKEEEDERMRLSTAIEQAAESIVVTDIRGNIQYVNPAFQHLNGYNRDQVIDREIKCIQAVSKDPLFCNLAEILKKGDVWKGRTTFMKKNEEHYQAETTLSPVRNTAGIITNWVWVSHDVTKEASLEAQLIQAQKMEAIGELSSGIAHEINTPTQYIGDNIRFFQESFSDITELIGRYEHLLKNLGNGDIDEHEIDELTNYTDEIDWEFLAEEVPLAISQSLEGNSRVAEIIRAMKEFAHPGSEERTCIDINHAIGNTMAVARNEWKYVAVVESNLDSTLPMVPCYPGAFNQVILNIFVNAAHAIGERTEGGSLGKGTITVSTLCDDKFAEIRIKDTGNGIPEDIQNKIFNPFFTTKGIGKGTGQGLSLVHNVIVDKHQGKIDFETEIGQGTTFILKFPLEIEPSFVEQIT
jgi:PAS domain S-box-containing protein